MNTWNRGTWVAVCLGGLLGCAETTLVQPEEAPAPVQTEAEPEQQVKKPEAHNEAPQPAPPAARLVFSLEGAGLSAPEAVRYEPEEDVYLVSNVAGDPFAVDGNGFISKVSPEGKMLELKFIDGSSKQTPLDAPKGMAIKDGQLYVADITWVRVFDLKSGAPRAKLFAQGATFLNDVAVQDGVVFVTDSGWKPGFEDTGSDAILQINPKKVVVEPYLAETSLGNPNGIVATKDGLVVVGGKGEMYSIADRKKGPPTSLPAGFLDGVIALEDGSFLVASWAGKSIFQGKPGGEFRAVVTNLPSPAAIGFDTKRKRLLVPSMKEDRVLCFELTSEEGAEAAVAPAPQAVAEEAKAPSEP